METSATSSISSSVIGFGTKLKPRRFFSDIKYSEAVYEAINSGYRHIDIGSTYTDVEEIAKGIRRALYDGITTRKSLFLTYSISVKQLYDIESEIGSALEKMNQDYFDLLILRVQVPRASKSPDIDLDSFVHAYKILTQLVVQGKLKNIGVANFGLDLLQAISQKASITPYCNQIEITPYNTQEEIVSYCKQEGIVVIAHTPLGGSKYYFREFIINDDLLTNGTLKDLANKYSITPEVLISESRLQKSLQYSRTKTMQAQDSYIMKKRDRVIDIELEDINTIEKIIGDETFFSRFSKEETLLALSSKYQQPVQIIILNWHLRRGCKVIVGSTEKNHFIANLEQSKSFTLEDEEVFRINKLNQNLRIFDGYRPMPGEMMKWEAGEKIP